MDILKKRALRFCCLLSTIVLFLAPVHLARAASPVTGFGKSSWGMNKDEILSAHQVILKSPTSSDASGIWAIEGPAPGELTISGEALGEPDVRSVSYGVHPKWGLAIIHVRFKETNDPGHVEKQLPLWSARFGEPTERKPGPKIIWEDEQTHIELTYHTVSLRHPTPADHLAIVLWSKTLMAKIEAEGIDTTRQPDVEKLEPMKQPHKEK